LPRTCPRHHTTDGGGGGGAAAAASCRCLRCAIRPSSTAWC
jgi:hypothetical protein